MSQAHVLDVSHITHQHTSLCHDIHKRHGAIHNKQNNKATTAMIENI